MYGVPPQGHLQGPTRDNSNTRFFHTKKEHIDMCSYIISVVYIYVVSYLVWREYDIVATNEWKKKCVGLQKTWVSKRTVCQLIYHVPTLGLRNILFPLSTSSTSYNWISHWIVILIGLFNNSMPRCWEKYRGAFQLVRMKIWIYHPHTI